MIVIVIGHKCRFNNDCNEQNKWTQKKPQTHCCWNPLHSYRLCSLFRGVKTKYITFHVTINELIKELLHTYAHTGIYLVLNIIKLIYSKKQKKNTN